MKDSSLSQIFAIDYNPQKLKLLEISAAKLSIPESLFDRKICNGKTDQDIYFPLIITAKDESFKIIDGCKRFLALKEKKLETIICCITEQTYSDKTAGLLRIMLNKNRKLELREKIVFSRWLKSNLSQSLYVSMVSELGISKRERIGIEMLQNCPDRIIDIVESGKLDIGLIYDFLLINEKDFDAVFGLFSKFSFTRQTQKELLEWLPEIAYRKKCSINEILEDKNICKIIENGKLNDPQKMTKIRDLIFTMKHPNFMRVKEKWKKLEKEVNPDPLNIQFRTSEAFEKDRLEIKIIAKDPENAKRLFNKLSLISENTWEKLIYPLNKC